MYDENFAAPVLLLSCELHYVIDSLIDLLFYIWWEKNRVRKIVIELALVATLIFWKMSKMFYDFLKPHKMLDLKKPWLYSRWGFRDTFQKSAFHVMWSGNILKLPMGNIFWVAELFYPWFRAIFLKISQMQWNLDFFAILAKYVAGVAKK